MNRTTDTCQQDRAISATALALRDSAPDLLEVYRALQRAGGAADSTSVREVALRVIREAESDELALEWAKFASPPWAVGAEAAYRVARALRERGITGFGIHWSEQPVNEQVDGATGRTVS